MILISPNDVKYVTRRCDGVLLNVPYRINKRSLAFLELILTEYLDHVCFGLDLGLPLGYPDDRKITKRTKKSYISSIHNLCVRASALSLLDEKSFAKSFLVTCVYKNQRSIISNIQIL